MLTIIHGDNIKDSREFYFQSRQKFPSAKILQGDKIAFTDLVEAVEGNGLFTNDNVQDIFIETLLTKKHAGKELDGFIQYLSQHADAKITLWEQKQLDKKLLNKFTKAQIREFSYPQTLFQFLDALGPKNTAQLIKLYHQTLQSVEVEVILFMITKQIRLLLGLKDTQGSMISEIRFMQPWQKPKLEKQAKLFTIEQLLFLHGKLYDFDWGYKSGALATSLEDSLDFFLAEI